MIEGRALRLEDRPEVVVAASTSNLGPGFDVLGLALSLRLRVRIAGAASGAQHELALASDEARAWPSAADNLLVRAFERALDLERGARAQPLRFEASSEIPLARGLGGSAAAIVAGLLLGAALSPAAIERDEILRLALEIEGHPDNVAPALLGGCVIAVPRAGRAPRIVRQALHRSLAFAVAWPKATFATSLARELLPREVAFADAVENPRRLALLLEGLRTGDPELLELGGEDRLHVSYRVPHIQGAAQAIAAARANGAWLATLSGSGSAVFAIASGERASDVARAMAAAFRASTGTGTGKVVEVASEMPLPRVS